ncbi:uncharacterized protein LOC110269331 [Arachis ipaensis]|uniref:uncharacterized protein LOC110269331 n=1 Tax=Arachis ipaensis TaxID=130454 RepID=UPI000A2B811B|nr:uncharacterized protein LOC110269331 [Arachis ipaensis]
MVNSPSFHFNLQFYAINFKLDVNDYHSYCRIVLGVAFSMFIIGTLANSRSRESCGISNNRTKTILTPNRFLSIGGILCFIHALFNVAYYVSVTASRREEKRQQSPN